MANIVKNRIASAVSALFSLGLNESVKTMFGKSFDIKDETHAELVYRFLVSESWRIAAAIASTIKVSTKPLQDQAAAGSRESDEAKAAMPPSESDIEREEDQRKLLMLFALVGRRCESLAEEIKKTNEQVGKKTTDGGRIRYTDYLKSRQFNAYHIKSLDQWCDDRIAEIHPMDQWYESSLARYNAMKELVVPLVSAQQAHDAVNEIYSGESATHLADKAWDKVIDQLAEYDQKLMERDAYNRAYGATPIPKDSAERDAARLEHVRTQNLLNGQLRTLKKSIERAFEATPLLATVESLDWLIKSPEWRLHQSKVDLSELELTLMEQEVQLNTIKVQARSLEISDQIDSMGAEMEAIKAKIAARKAAKAPAVIPPQQPEPTVEKPKAVSRGPRTHNGAARTAAH